MPLEWGTWARRANLGYWGVGDKGMLLGPLLVNVGAPQCFGRLAFATGERLERCVSHFDLEVTPPKVPQLSYNHSAKGGNFLIVKVSYNRFPPVG